VDDLLKAVLKQSPQIAWWLFLLFLSGGILRATRFFHTDFVPPTPRGNFLAASWAFHLLASLFALIKLWGWTRPLVEKCDFLFQSAYCFAASRWPSGASYVALAVGLICLWIFACRHIRWKSTLKR
jgi:hypothetical protein